MEKCPNCRQRVPDGYPLCPYCGTDMATGKRSERDVQQREKDAVGNGTCVGCLLTAASYFVFGAGMVLGRNMMYLWPRLTPDEQANLMFSATYNIWIGFGLPLLLIGVTYLLLRRRFPAFARGLGYSFLVAFAIALGAPFWCNTGPG